MRKIETSEILTRETYERRRPELRRRIMTEKAKRRVPVGDHCSVHFENHDTMLYQVHEMLRAEGTWDNPEAVAAEIGAYNPIVPSPGELSATLMFEYETEAERAVVLPKLVGIDRHVWLEIGDSPPLLAALDRGQIDAHKVSSVQYARWTLGPRERALLKEDGAVVRLRFDHPEYRAQAVVSEETRRAIMNDPD
jgi:hypothetical protein